MIAPLAPTDAPPVRDVSHILVVDDENDVRDTITEMLKMSGHHCVGVGGVAEAMERLAKEDFDLIISDMHMPGESGLDLIERVRNLDDSIPVILVTGYPSLNTAISAMKRGAVDFIPKPFDFDSITQLVAKALRERKLRQEIRRLQADANKTHVIEKLNRELYSRVDELERLYAISEAMSHFSDIETLFTHIVELAAKVTGAQRVSLMTLDRGRRTLRIRAAIGVPHDVRHRTRVRVGEGIAGKVVQEGRLVRATSFVSPAFDMTRDTLGLGSYASQSWISLPLMIGGKVYGALNLTDKPDRSDFGLQEENILQTLVEKAGVKLENQALYEGLYANMIDTLNSLVTTIEAKDPYTRQHSHRVAEYAVRIAEVLGLSGEQIEMIQFAAVLHDIGKIGIRDEILTKSGKLTDEEYIAIQQHVLVGAKIVEPLGLSPVELAIVRNHHERFDGKGYPDNLSGEQIPLLARIVSVADAFDAMTSTRPYRKALSPHAASLEIEKNKGAQFDPVIADAAMRAIEEGKILVRIEADDAEI